MSERVRVFGDHFAFEGEDEWLSGPHPKSAPRDAARVSFSANGGWGEEMGWLRFQCGPVPQFGVNGVTIEEVAEVMLHRLRELNGKFPCRENALAITNFEQGLMWLNERTRKRVAQGVEGKEVAHV